VTIVGLTGSFCSGKTSCAKIFGKLGATVINADDIVHRMYRTDKALKKAILRRFGKGVFTPGGNVDRAGLAARAFGSRNNLNSLQKIVHPKVISEIKKRALGSTKPVVIVDAALLLESGLENFVDYIVVVRANLDKCVERASPKGFTRRETLRRRAMQMPLAQKLRRADFVINNNRSKKDMEKEVRKIWKKLPKE